MRNSTDAFRDAMQSTFGPLDLLPIADGNIHRFHVPGDCGGSRNGWFILHLDGIATDPFAPGEVFGPKLALQLRVIDVVYGCRATGSSGPPFPPR